MKEIQLTQGQVALVDDEDFEWLNGWKWYAHRDRNTFYAARAGGRVNGSMTTITMHSVIIGKPPKGLETDHRDGNGLNNQRKNLRFVTTRQNAQNRKNKVKPKTSQYVGVWWDKQHKKWASKINVGGKAKFLGRFTSELQAFQAYQQAVESLGQFVIDTDDSRISESEYIEQKGVEVGDVETIPIYVQVNGKKKILGFFTPQAVGSLGEPMIDMSG